MKNHNFRWFRLELCFRLVKGNAFSLGCRDRFKTRSENDTCSGNTLHRNKRKSADPGLAETWLGYLIHFSWSKQNKSNPAKSDQRSPVMSFMLRNMADLQVRVFGAPRSPDRGVLLRFAYWSRRKELPFGSHGCSVKEPLDNTRLVGKRRLMKPW